ncbi:general transcription factor 3c polypeptide [Plakobranchus ocellatus]|uniref:General transcription factor 3c polypeptide n=1 Tax=Plakobranchus ocellatus TaxID=259542 RepID=A0AAV3Y4G4_9GAST|nr:general transcription factor 3c polypeptide [Plakobranchus ocellatus]
MPFLKEIRIAVTIMDIFKSLGIWRDNASRISQCRFYVFCVSRILNNLFSYHVEILKVGYAWRRLVTRQHARPWLVEMPDACGKGDAVTGDGSSKGASSSVGSALRPPPTTVVYQVRPWRHFHGRRLDLGGLRRVLERVLSDVMARPGQRVAALCDQLNPHILPVVTLDALEILEEIGCIRFVSLQARPKLDMFSNRSRKMSLCSQSDTSPVDMAVDVPVAAPLRFVSFIQAVRRHCEPLNSRLSN